MKKNVLAVIFLLIFTSCTSTEQLRTQKSCSIWKDQGSLGPMEVAVQEEKVKVRTKCMFYFWLCSSYEFRMGEDKKIYGKGPFSIRGEIALASLSENKVTYEPSVLESLVKSSPILLDMKTHKANRTVEVPLLKNVTDNQELEFNSTCTKNEAAIGAVALWTVENRQ